MLTVSRRCQSDILIASRVLILSCIASCLLAVSTAAQSPPKPKVFIAATGGTIAGVQKSVEQHGYTAGELGIEALVNAVPQLKDLADVRGEQVVNIPSQDMTDAVWLQLAKRLQELEQSPDVTGIVVTHGTDTLEETSFFIELTVDTPKPMCSPARCVRRPQSARTAR